MDRETSAPALSYRDLFTIFFKAGCAFGGGLGILAVLEDELVTKRQAVNRDEFLAIYGMGRIVPSGTMTALAVAYGYRFGGFAGTLVTLVALVLPAFLITIGLTAAYTYLKGSQSLTLLPITLLPAAVALIVAAALNLGKHVFRPSADLVLAVGAFVGACVFGINPSILLVRGGLVGIRAFGRTAGDRA